MKTLHVIILALVAGVAIGGALGYQSVPAAVVAGVTASGDSTDTGPAARESRPVAVLDATSFDFGVMQQGTTRSHAFTVRNDGSSPLTVRVGSTSCKCTVGDVAKYAIPVGGSSTVTLEWIAKTAPGPFRQVATLLTNDPAKPSIELSVEGKVVEPAGLEPNEFHFGEVNTSDEKSVSVLFFSLHREDLEVTAEAPQSAGVKDNFEVDVTPVAPEELPTEGAKAGYRITLTAKPGLPIGAIMEWVTLKTNLEETPKLEAPVFGRVVGDITVHGAAWSEETGVLRLGLVRSAEGAERKLVLSVKGEHAAETRFELIETTPSELEVEIGEPVQRGDQAMHTPLTISVPPGTRSMIHLNTDQGDDGVVRLKTTHPDVDEVKIAVRFAVTS